jgi:hypothetical protein
VSAIEIVTLGIVMTTGAPNPATRARHDVLGRDAVPKRAHRRFADPGRARYKEQDYNLRGAQRVPERHRLARGVRARRAELHVHDTPGRRSPGHRKASWSSCASGSIRFSWLSRRPVIARSFVEHGEKVDDDDHAADRPATGAACGFTSAFLVVYLALTLYLVEKLAVLLNHGLDQLGAPPAFGALIVAALVLAPEGLSGIQAALANRMQRAVNILLGPRLRRSLDDPGCGDDGFIPPPYILHLCVCYLSVLHIFNICFSKH